MDEIQRVPDLFPVLRGIIDRRRRAEEKTGQFLILGSASLDLLRQSSESLAGRIVYRELTPILADEWESPGGFDALWVRGGYPESLLAADEATSREWRDALVATYLERDVPQLGPRIPAETLRRFWTMLALFVRSHQWRRIRPRRSVTLGSDSRNIIRGVRLGSKEFAQSGWASPRAREPKRITRSR